MTSHMNFTRRIRVLISSADPAACEFMQSALAALSQYDSELASLDSLLRGKSKIDPDGFDLLVLDVGDGSVLESASAQEVRGQFSTTPLIVVSELLSDQHMRLLFRLNGADWLKKPLDRKSFLETVANHVHLGQSGSNKVHAVIGAVGGAGATSISASLADCLTRTKKKRQQPTVALFDLDFSTGACGHHLNTLNDYDLKPIIGNPSRVDLEFIDIVKRKHERGFSLLSFKQPDVHLSPRGSELVLRMVDVVSFQNNHTVLDIPYYETAWKGDLLAAVNTIYLVTELTIPALRQAKDIYTRIKGLRSDSPDIHLIVNKHRSSLFSFGIGRKDPGKIFKQTKTIFVQDDWKTLSEALNRGLLPVEVHPRSSFAKSVEKLAELVR